MGFRNIGSLVLIFLILMMIFGTKRLRDLGGDLAGAIRHFRKGLQEESEEKKDDIVNSADDSNLLSQNKASSRESH